MLADALPLPQYLVISLSDSLPYSVLILSYYPLREWVNRFTGRSICWEASDHKLRYPTRTNGLVARLDSVHLVHKYTNHILHWSNQARHYVALPSLSCDLLKYISLSNILNYQVDLFVKCVGIGVMGLLKPLTSQVIENVQNILHNYPSAIIVGEIARLLD